MWMAEVLANSYGVAAVEINVRIRKARRQVCIMASRPMASFYTERIWIFRLMRWRNNSDTVDTESDPLVSL